MMYSCLNDYCVNIYKSKDDVYKNSGKNVISL